MRDHLSGPQAIVAIFAGAASVWPEMHREPNSPTDLIDYILENETEISKALCKRFFNPFTKQFAWNNRKQRARFLRRVTPVPEHAFSSKGNQLVQAFLLYSRPVSLP